MTVEKIRLPRDGAEYAYFTFSPELSTFPVGTVLEVQVGGSWYALDVSSTVPRLLLKGPSAPAGSAGVTVTADGPLRVRVKNAPETIVRGAGYVALVN